MFLFILTIVMVQASTHVIELNDSIVELLDQGPWLINFYAPWCGYCRRLEPTYTKVGEYLANLGSPLKVARLDATTYLKAGRYFQIDGFPTIKYVDHDHSYTYTGDRNLHSLVSFALKATGPAVKLIDSASAFETNATQVKPDPFFVLFNNGDSFLKVSYTKLAEQYRLMSWFFAVNSPSAIPTKYAHLVDEAKEPFRGVIVFKDGDGFVYPGFPGLPTNSQLEQDLRDWILRERYPIFMEARLHDLWEVGATEMALQSQPPDVDLEASLKSGTPATSTYRLVALFLLSPSKDGDEMSRRFKELGQTLSQKRLPELVKRYHFAWSSKELDVLSDLAMVQLTSPSLVVVDPITRMIYLNPNQTELNGLFSLESDVVISFLLSVADGRVIGHGGNTVSIRLRRLAHNFVKEFLNFVRTSPVIALLIFVIPAMFISCIGYVCCCLDERYDDIEPETEHGENKSDSSSQQRLLSPVSTTEKGDHSASSRRRVAGSPKHPAPEVMHLGPVLSKEEIEARRAAYQNGKKSN